MRCFTSLRFVLHDIPLVISSIPLSYRATRGISQYKCFTAFCMTFPLSFRASLCHSEYNEESHQQDASLRCAPFCMTLALSFRAFPLSFRASPCHSECNEESFKKMLHCVLHDIPMSFRAFPCHSECNEESLKKMLHCILHDIPHVIPSIPLSFRV